MSQSATFYRLDKNDFSALENIRVFDWYAQQKGYVVLSGTHEGLRYLLKKKTGDLANEFIDELFYPLLYLEKGDPEMENVPSEKAIFYHPPITVTDIMKFLETWNVEDITAVFDPTELNTKGVYPCNWHNNESSQFAYNLRALLLAFQDLKDFFRTVAKEEQYVLVFIG